MHFLGHGGQGCKKGGRWAGLYLRVFLWVALVPSVFIGLQPVEDISRVDRQQFEALAVDLGRSEAWNARYGAAFAMSYTRAMAIVERGMQAEWWTSDVLTHSVYLPLLVKTMVSPMVERRALWVTRYDWTTLEGASVPEAIDVIVARAAAAGFNTIYFQVRGAGDAYYAPGLEPWAGRLSAGPVSTTLGTNPGWDPLARMVEVGHAAGLEVHAYVNVYPAWQSPPSAAYGTLWPPATSPPQMFDRFTYDPSYVAHPGDYGLGYTWRQYDEAGAPMPLTWNHYLWASPGLDQVVTHTVAVVDDIVRRYPVDGVHLDLVRYAGPGFSYDPFSNAAAGKDKTPSRDQWQRDRVTLLVRRIRDQAKAIRPDIVISAAVWPYYVDTWGWGVTEGYGDLYQDSKGWLTNGDVDAIVPMLYGGYCDDSLRWHAVVEDFLKDGVGDGVYPGIGGYYDDFEDIAWRIEAARAAGARGHALFSFRWLDARGFWDDLAAGPYRVPAVVP